MIPTETGYYWLKLTPASNWQVVYVVRGEDVLYAGLSERSTRMTFDDEYPHARWGEQLNHPAPKLAMICGVDCIPGDAVCNNYCNAAPQKGPIADAPPPGRDAVGEHNHLSLPADRAPHREGVKCGRGKHLSGTAMSKPPGFDKFDNLMKKLVKVPPKAVTPPPKPKPRKRKK